MLAFPRKHFFQISSLELLVVLNKMRRERDILFPPSYLSIDENYDRENQIIRIPDFPDNIYDFLRLNKILIERKKIRDFSKASKNDALKFFLCTWEEGNDPNHIKKKVFPIEIRFGLFITKQNYWFNSNFINANWVYHCSYKLKIFLSSQDSTYWLIVVFPSIYTERKDDRWQVFQGD